MAEETTAIAGPDDDVEHKGIPVPDDEDETSPDAPSITPSAPPAIHEVAAAAPPAAAPSIPGDLPAVRAAGPQLQPAQHVNTPGETAISQLSAVQRQNPFAMAMANASNIQNPFLRILAKIGAGVGAGAEAGAKNYPEIQKERAAEAAQPSETAAREATTEKAKAETAAIPGQMQKTAAETYLLQHPKAKFTGEVFSDGRGGYMQMDESMGQYAPVNPPAAAAGPAGAQAPAAGAQPAFTKPAVPTDANTKAAPEQVAAFPKDVQTQHPKLTPGQVQSLTSELGQNPTIADLAKIRERADTMEKDAEISAATAGRHADTEADRRAAAAEKKASKFYTYTDPDGKVQLASGDKVPAGVEATPVKDADALVTEARTGNIIQESLNKIHADVNDHPEIFDNAAARAVMATTLEQIDRASAGLLIAGTGGSIPLPSGLGDMINTYLQNNALDSKTAEAVRNYIADYKSMKDKVVAMQMEMQGGKMGRGSAQAFKAIADQIPNGATPDSKTATHQLANLQETQTELMSKYPEHYQNYTKATPYQAKAKAAEAHVPGGQASGLKEGATGTGNDGKKYVVKGGKWQAK